MKPARPQTTLTRPVVAQKPTVRPTVSAMNPMQSSFSIECDSQVTPKSDPPPLPKKEPVRQTNYKPYYDGGGGDGGGGVGNDGDGVVVVDDNDADDNDCNYDVDDDSDDVDDDGVDNDIDIDDDNDDDDDYNNSDDDDCYNDYIMNFKY